MFYEWVKPVVKGAEGSLGGLSIIGKITVALSFIPYLASYWFMNPIRLIPITVTGLIVSMTYLVLIGDSVRRLRPLILVWILSEATGLLVVLMSGGGLSPVALLNVTLLSTLILVALTGFVVSLALLRLSEVKYILNVMGLGTLGDSLVLSLRYLLNASVAMDEAYMVLKSLGSVKPRLLVNSLVANGVRYSIILAQYIEYYGIPSVKPRVTLSRLDSIALIPLTLYLILLAL
ncbi:hypothetical protein [Caldivirga maquilingensis]|uniref:Cobalt transport protein n=1 Tax=Caldivirga maquilingensis (strain ATCC 700844 / DSM 13496 / JCM 10307 / IC-167) TaxID=397948 RepID=A8M8U4_CALMQ|nr:hypothetical protein [Caldivirga maquilingensis]ABW02163.1 hypothetical protein Cmaq_1337 [Caldivirga maquilingensis IC-167]